MALTGFVSQNHKKLNSRLLQCAAEHVPAILIDCANSADPHRFYPAIDLPTMQQIYVFELELLHKFRDVLRKVPIYAKKLNAQIIVVTTSDHLFNYHNEDENRNVNVHAWQLMKKIGYSYEIVVGIYPHSEQYHLAKKYCVELKEI